MLTRQDWLLVLRHPGTCTEEVEDDEGELGPCGDRAIAVRQDMREGGAPYPVCVEHTRAPMVSLDVILQAEHDEEIRAR